MVDLIDTQKHLSRMIGYSNWRPRLAKCIPDKVLHSIDWKIHVGLYRRHCKWNKCVHNKTGQNESVCIIAHTQPLPKYQPRLIKRIWSTRRSGEKLQRFDRLLPETWKNSPEAVVPSNGDCFHSHTITHGPYNRFSPDAKCTALPFFIFNFIHHMY